MGKNKPGKRPLIFTQDGKSQHPFQDRLLKREGTYRRPAFHGGREEPFDLFLQPPIFPPNAMVHSRPLEDSEKILGQIFLREKVEKDFQRGDLSPLIGDPLQTSFQVFGRKEVMDRGKLKSKRAKFHITGLMGRGQLESQEV